MCKRIKYIVLTKSSRAEINLGEIWMALVLSSLVEIYLCSNKQEFVEETNRTLQDMIWHFDSGLQDFIWL